MWQGSFELTVIVETVPSHVLISSAPLNCASNFMLIWPLTALSLNCKLFSRPVVQKIDARNFIVHILSTAAAGKDADTDVEPPGKGAKSDDADYDEGNASKEKKPESKLPEKDLEADQLVEKGKVKAARGDAPEEPDEDDDDALHSPEGVDKTDDESDVDGIGGDEVAGKRGDKKQDSRAGAGGAMPVVVCRRRQAPRIRRQHTVWKFCDVNNNILRLCCFIEY